MAYSKVGPFVNNSTPFFDTPAFLNGVEDGIAGAQDATQWTAQARLGPWQPAGALAVTIIDRSDLGGTLTPSNAGQLRLTGGTDVGMLIPAGTVISNLNIFTGSTAGATITNQWMCIVRQSTLAVQATTLNKTTTAIPATTQITYQVASTIGGSVAGSWTCPTTAIYYFGYAITATTAPTLVSHASVTAPIMAVAPAIAGTSTTGLTTPASLTTPVTTPTGGGSMFYCWAT
jgi:hypothetical protein